MHNGFGTRVMTSEILALDSGVGASCLLVICVRLAGLAGYTTPSFLSRLAVRVMRIHQSMPDAPHPSITRQAVYFQ